MSLQNQLPMQAVVSEQSELNTGQQAMRLTLFAADGTPIDLSGVGTPPTGAQVHLTGFTTGTAGAIAAGDTVNQAFAKIQARIVALEA